MTDPDKDNIAVTYTVKELLASMQREQAAGFARIETSMSSKADKSDVARMEARLDAHGKALDEHRTHISELQIQAREEVRARQAAERTNRWWHTGLAKVGGFIVGLAFVVTAVVTVVQLH